MNSGLRVVLAGACMTVGSLACTSRETESTVVFLVRHAEKVIEADGPMLGPAGDDPILTEEGAERARALAHALAEAGVDAIYATQYRRTQLTAQPLADLLGLPVRVVTAGPNEYTREMVDLVRSDHVGDVVLVVSHSNTVPALIEALGAAPVPFIEDDEYDDLYVVALGVGGRTSLLSLRYGRETQ